MFHMELPLVDAIQPQINKFVTGVKNKAAGDYNLNDSPAIGQLLLSSY